MGSLLQVTNLSRKFDSLQAVDAVSFHVGAGEAFGLLGPNGAGKSTIMMMLSGVLKPDAGAVLLNGHSVHTSPRSLRHVLGVVPQDLAIYPDLTAAENLRFFGSLYHVTGNTLRERVREALERVGLWDRRNDRAGHFSGGMKRRLNFSAAILHRPSLLILDEPTVGVDPQSRRHLLDCVRSLQKNGTAIIYASHYMEEVEAVCSRVAIMDHGRILKCDTLASLLSLTDHEVELQLPGDAPVDDLELPTGIAIEQDSDVVTFRVTADSGTSAQPNRSLCALVTQISERGIPLLSLQTHQPSLERLFLALTGTRLRD